MDLSGRPSLFSREMGEHKSCVFVTVEISLKCSSHRTVTHFGHLFHATSSPFPWTYEKQYRKIGTLFIGLLKTTGSPPKMADFKVNAEWYKGSKIKLQLSPAVFSSREPQHNTTLFLLAGIRWLQSGLPGWEQPLLSLLFLGFLQCKCRILKKLTFIGPGLLARHFIHNASFNWGSFQTQLCQVLLLFTLMEVAKGMARHVSTEACWIPGGCKWKHLGLTCRSTCLCQTAGPPGTFACYGLETHGPGLVSSRRWPCSFQLAKVVSYKDHFALFYPPLHVFLSLRWDFFFHPGLISSMLFQLKVKIACLSCFACWTPNSCGIEMSSTTKYYL